MNTSEYVDYITVALQNLGGKAPLSEIYSEFEKLTRMELNEKERSNIRWRIEENSSDSKIYKGENDLFYSAEGLGKGVWGLRS